MGTEGQSPNPAHVVLPGGSDLQATIQWFESIGFRMLMISPADNPSVSLLEGHGLRIRLDRAAAAGATALRIPAVETSSTVAPNGTTVEFVAEGGVRRLPENVPEFVHSRLADAGFDPGRAGMGYRDLIPNRQGGRFIASHISIPDGGPVPDYVHHHDIRFQMIFCNAGWAELVYEDQGPSFRMEAGDCVLQPPHIRHRVLETSDNFEVVEIGCPAVHDTLRDHDLDLPTANVDPHRNFGGQRFVWHRASEAPDDGYVNFGIDAATDGLATVGMIRSPDQVPLDAQEFRFWFIRSGSIRVNGQRVAEGDSLTFVPAEDYEITDGSDDFEALVVLL